MKKIFVLGSAWVAITTALNPLVRNEIGFDLFRGLQGLVRITTKASWKAAPEPEADCSILLPGGRGKRSHSSRHSRNYISARES